MSRKAPFFIVGGAPRSGTTWLYRVLDRHPELYMARPVRPEPKFFLVDDIYEKGFDFYLDNWFADVPEHAKAGEKTTNYLESRVAAQRIHMHLPDVRNIFILREPASRALSNWRWSCMNGMETLPFEEAIRREPEREARYSEEDRFSRPHSYYSRGLYREMLQPYVDLFGLERILCLRYEDIAADSSSLATRTHDFLGVARRERDVKALGKVNPSRQESTEDSPDLTGLRRRYEEPNRELQQLLGSRFDIWEE